MFQPAWTYASFPPSQQSIILFDDLVVVDTPDALLIIPRGDTEQVKEVVDNFEKEKRDSLL